MSTNMENNDEAEEASLLIPQDDLAPSINKGQSEENDDNAPLNESNKSNQPQPSRVLHPPSRLDLVSNKCKLMFGKVHQFLQLVAESTARYLRNVFTLPLVRGNPISFARPEDFNAAGELIPKSNQEEYEKAMDMLEASCNYSEKTKAILQKIIRDRKASAATKRAQAKGIDWSKLAPWNESFLGHLESTFQVFDSSGDALIDFDELALMLTDYGDKTTPEDRVKVFSSADPTGKGALSFKEFVIMFHNITVKSPDNYPSTIVESFRSIDRNMARIRGLDVVQQLQAGLF